MPSHVLRQDLIQGGAEVARTFATNQHTVLSIDNALVANGSRCKRVMAQPQLHDRINQLWRDESGNVLSIETLVAGTVLLVGLVTALSGTRDAVVSELSDVVGSLQDVNMSYAYLGSNGHSASVAGSSYSDSTDFCDAPEDVAGGSDNCITFDGDAFDEGEPLGGPGFILSEVGTFSFTDVNTGRDGDATGTIGDGVIDTGFTITTVGANLGNSFNNEIIFSEQSSDSGSFKITFDDPVTDLQFWVRNLAFIDAADPENLFGNFTLTLSDGTVLNNAAFDILPDAIAPNSNYGQFSTRGSDRDLLQAVTRGGVDYVTDPTANGAGSQAAGRLVFTDVPVVSDPPPSGAVGIQCIEFERSGGPDRFRATFSTSARVLAPAP